MKLTIGILFFLSLSLSASVYSQQYRITLNMENVTLEQVIEAVKVQTGLSFFYNASLFKNTSKVSIHVTDELLSSFLTDALTREGLTYDFQNDVVVIKKVAIPQQQNVLHLVTGQVTDEHKHPLPGVTITIKTTPVGAITDKNGRYRIGINRDNFSLIFSFIGMKSVEVAYTGQDTINVVMRSQHTEIEEVVITGYQTIREKSMAGAYSKIKSEDLMITGNETIEQLLQGKLPGVVVTNPSGLTGTRQKVRVRGTSTLVGNADPVWVVDGIIQEDNLPFESSTLASMDDNLDMMKDFIGGAVSWLNPNDIEDITVLKDASATAIYGVKAANGVILITTKKGERGRLSINYSGNLSLSQRLNYNRMEIMNSKDRVALSREAFERGARIANETVGYSGLALAYARREISQEEFYSGVKKLETVNTDWFDILYQTPFSQSHSISFSGGSDNATYRASFGYRNQQNTAKGNEQVSYTGSLSVTSVFWNKLTLTALLSGSHTDTKAFASGVDPYGYAINTSRVISCYEDNKLFYYDVNRFGYNILNELANSGNENTSRSLNLNLNARWRIYEDLTLSATLGGASSASFAETWYTERSHKITAIRGYEYGVYSTTDVKYKESVLPFGGMLTVSESRNFNYTARIQAEYVKLFNGVHALNLVAGMEARSNQYDGYSQTNWGYMPDRGKTFTNVPLTITDINGFVYDNLYARTFPAITDRLANYLSYYVSGSYMYDNRYSINLSLRGDASNRFGSSHEFQNVWSGGLRWNVSDEHWMQNQDLISNLAFTASLGYQGNVAENVSPGFIAKMGAVNSETGEWTMTWSQLPNPNLKPEKTLSINAGINFAFFKNKVSGTFNWYYKKTRDVITSAKVPYENGTTSMALNDGNMKNKGWDLALNVVPVRTKNFMWSLGTSFSGNDNTVNSKLETTGEWQEAKSGSFYKDGYPVGSFWAFRFTGLNPEHGAPMFDFSRAVSEKAAEDATEYMVYMGTLEPTFTVGINMVFRWKRFSFPLNFYISRGNYTFLQSPYTTPYMMMSEYQNASSQLNKRWQNPGDEEYTDIPSIPVGENCRILYPFKNSRLAGQGVYPLEAWAYSDVRVVNAWYIRFNDFRFSYNLPDKWIRKCAKSVSLSFTASNPLQIKSKDFKGRDPEVAMGKQPRSQDFSFGISMSF